MNTLQTPESWFELMEKKINSNQKIIEKKIEENQYIIYLERRDVDSFSYSYPFEIAEPLIRIFENTSYKIYRFYQYEYENSVWERDEKQYLFDIQTKSGILSFSIFKERNLDYVIYLSDKEAMGITEEEIYEISTILNTFVQELKEERLSFLLGSVQIGFSLSLVFEFPKQIRREHVFKMHPKEFQFHLYADVMQYVQKKNCQTIWMLLDELEKDKQICPELYNKVQRILEHKNL